jgi:hypothetical protein
LDEQGQRCWIVGLCGEAFEMLAASFHGATVSGIEWLKIQTLASGT